MLSAAAVHEAAVNSEPNILGADIHLSPNQEHAGEAAAAAVDAFVEVQCAAEAKSAVEVQVVVQLESVAQAHSLGASPKSNPQEPGFQSQAIWKGVLLPTQGTLWQPPQDQLEMSPARHVWACPRGQATLRVTLSLSLPCPCAGALPQIQRLISSVTRAV